MCDSTKLEKGENADLNSKRTICRTTNTFKLARQNNGNELSNI